LLERRSASLTILIDGKYSLIQGRNIGTMSIAQQQQVTAGDWLGRKLGKYKITEVLGAGGKGLVFRAHDMSIERDVAIKVLTGQMSTDENERSRFLSEAKSAGKFNHVNTVTIHEAACDESVLYLVMEIVSGGSAHDHLERSGAYSVPEATRMTIEACMGLAAAHQEGFIHRDINPANLLLTDDGTVKVSDFRLAKQTSHANAQNLTLVGQLIGTPHFMSPEQCEFDSVDARSDIYSLGATYFSLLTGRRPYEDRKSDVLVMLAHCDADPPDPRAINSDVPDACAQIIEQAMARQADERYQSMDEMRGDLEAVSEAMAWGYDSAGLGE
jgi:serine/threonine protein kinase